MFRLKVGIIPRVRSSIIPLLSLMNLLVGTPGLQLNRRRMFESWQGWSLAGEFKDNVNLLYVIVSDLEFTASD